MSDDQTPPAENGESNAAPTQTLIQRLTVALSGQNPELAALQTHVATLTQERDAARASLAEAESAVATFEARVAEAIKNQTAAQDATFDKKVTAAAVEQVAASGIPPQSLPAVTAAKGDPAVSLRAELASLPLTDSVNRGRIAGELLKLRNGKN